MSDSNSVSRSVWVLMFNRLPAAFTSDGFLSGGLSSGVFDELELQSTFFEQYLLQHVCESTGPAELLGGQDATERFSSELRRTRKSTGVLRLVSADAVTVDRTGCLNAKLTVERRLTEDPVDAVSLRWRADSELRSLLNSDLVWIDVQVDDGEATAACRLLEVIQHLRKHTAQVPDMQAILIVSALRGSDCIIAEPFMPGLPESLIHVPLWIDNGVQQSCRIHSIVGSWDLLPTLAELLSGVDGDSALDQSAEMAWEAEQQPLSGAPMSLVNLCNAPRDVSDRILKLTGDGWTARRTQGFLLVNQRPTAGLDHQPGSDELTSIRLYLKPDDLWNVNDVSGTYSDVAEELARA